MKRMTPWVLAATLTFCGAMMMLTSCTDAVGSTDNPVPDPAQQDLADYAILFYGHGSDPSLDFCIVENLDQLYAAEAASYNKVRIAAQYKFSSQKAFQEQLETLRKSVNTEEQKKFVETFNDMFKDKCGQTYRFVVDPKMQSYDQLGDSYRYGPSEGEISNPDSLTNFIKWAAKACPAKNYLLLLSDHGAGYMPNNDLPYSPVAKTRNLVVDSHTGKGLTLPSLTAAIEAAGIHLKALYFDACLMNSIEYLFELKDAVDYVVASSFLVPGIGGSYDALINLLAKNGSDIESALAAYNKFCVDRWDKTIGQAQKESFFDMTVTRTSGLNAYGEKIRAFTDLLVEAYQSGDEELCKKIDNATANVLKIQSSYPFYDLLIYALTVTLADPARFEAAYNDMKKCYDELCQVSHQTSAYMGAEGITASVLLGWDGQYEYFDWMPDDTEWKVLTNTIYKPDGTCDMVSFGMPASGNWGSTFEQTYEQTKFDKATGWSRWIKANRQRPTVMSLATAGYDPNIAEADPAAYLTFADFVQLLNNLK
ncbi:MAG: hypothetical protein J5658_00400 [Prevotella sp.]|nr:hypothetical protein [Prevotella sp.]